MQILCICMHFLCLFFRSKKYICANLYTFCTCGLLMMIGMSVCVAAYMTKSALKFLEKNVATKVSNYKTSLWRVFSLCASSNYIEIKCCFYDFYICCLFLRFDSYFAKYLTTAVATAEEDVVLVALPLTHLSNEIFKAFEIKMIHLSLFKNNRYYFHQANIHWILLVFQTVRCWAEWLKSCK